jgi:hypothetical protein
MTTPIDVIDTDPRKSSIYEFLERFDRGPRQGYECVGVSNKIISNEKITQDQIEACLNKHPKNDFALCRCLDSLT